jgi:arylformamidase
MDCPSADDLQSKTLDVHHELLDHGACVLENLDLREVEAGEYVLDALPMKVAGLDAAPVRALLTGIPI